MKNILIYFCFLIVLAACEPPVYFDSPQPSNGKVEQTFNKKYVGRYKSTTADGVFLEVSEEKVISERFWEVKQTKSKGLGVFAKKEIKKGSLNYGKNYRYRFRYR